MPRAQRQLQNTDELKQARSKVSSIAGYYTSYKKKANEGYGGSVSIRGVTVGQARANDYIRAHKDDIWKYRTAFAAQFDAEHPDVRNIGLNARPAQGAEEQDENEQSRTHSEEGDLSMRSGSSNTENSVIGEQNGSIPGVDAPRQSLGPNALNGNEDENNAPAREGALPEGVVKEIANLERIEAYDLNRFFLGDTRSMIQDYFAITRRGGAGDENLAELDTKQSNRGVLSDKLDKADGRKSAAGDDPMNSNLTPGQEEGLSEIAKFLYQNCARRKRNKITLLDGLLLRSARERLLIYYLVEKNKYDSPAENFIVESQTYTPDIENFKKSIERSGFNIFGRMFIGSMHWSYLSKAAQVAMDCREKLAFMAASGMFAQGAGELDGRLRRRAAGLLDEYPNSYINLMRDHQILEVSEDGFNIIRLNDDDQDHHEEENHEEQNHEEQNHEEQNPAPNLDRIDGLSEIHDDAGSNLGDQSGMDFGRGLPGGDNSFDSIDLDQLEDGEHPVGTGEQVQNQGNRGEPVQPPVGTGELVQNQGNRGEPVQNPVGKGEQVQNQEGAGEQAPENKGSVLKEGQLNSLDPGSENYIKGDIDRPNPNGFANSMVVVEDGELNDSNKVDNASEGDSSYYVSEKGDDEPVDKEKEARLAERRRLENLNLHAPLSPDSQEDIKIFNDDSSYFNSKDQIELENDLDGKAVENLESFVSDGIQQKAKVKDDPNESVHAEMQVGGGNQAPEEEQPAKIKNQLPNAPAHEQPVVIPNAPAHEQPVVIQNQIQPEAVQNPEQPEAVRNQNRSVIVRNSEQPEVAQNPNRSVIVQNRNQPVPAPAPAPAQDVDEEGAQQRANARERLILKRNEAFTLAMNIGNAYIAMWKSKGALPEEQMPVADAQELKAMAMSYTVALKRLVDADKAVMKSVPDAPQPMQGNVPYVPGNVGQVVRKKLTSASTVAARKNERSASDIIKSKNVASLGYIASTSVTLVDKARNIGMVINPDMWSGSGNWNWGNPDFGKHLSESMANQWGWRLDGIFPRIEGGGTGVFTTIGAIAALVTFASGLTKMGATFKGGSAGDKAKYITSQLGLLVSASKDAMLDTVAWNTVFNGGISPQIIANLSSAAAVAGVVGGAINIALGAASIHTGRTAKKRLDDIGDWVVQNVQRGRNQGASPEQQRESEIINTANAAARRKADHNIRAGASQTVSGALFMIGGILSMSVAGAPLGAAIMLLGGGLTLVNSIVGYSKSKQRKREMIDDYIGINTLISAVKRYDPNAADLEDSKLAEYIREEAIGLMGFTSENGCFDYIAGRLSKALLEGIKKNAKAIEPGELQTIAQNPYNFIDSDVHEKKQVAHYILMIQSFGPKVKITRNRVTAPNETALAKSIAKI